MNNTQRPFYIVTQFYRSKDFKPVTLRGVVQKERGDISVSGLKSWLHIVMWLCDGLCYLHDKTVIHNDIKNDNIVIVRGSCFFSPVLIDFGKACLTSEARKNFHGKKKTFQKLLCGAVNEFVVEINLCILVIWQKKEFLEWGI